MSNRELQEEFKSKRWCVVKGELVRTAEDLLALVASVGLTGPITPPGYPKMGNVYFTRGVTTICTLGHGIHRAFDQADELPLHVDGTLCELGEVATTALCCLSSAATGGSTRIFYAAEAFRAITQDNPEMASALLDSRALTKSSDFDPLLSVTGPVFALGSHGPISRLAFDRTSRWNVDVIARLGDAKASFEELAGTAQYSAEVSLRPGEVLLMDNQRVAHGRSAFAEYYPGQRKFLRSLFGDLPFGLPRSNPLWQGAGLSLRAR